MTLGLTLWFVWLRLTWLNKVRPAASQKVKFAATIIILPLIAFPFPYGPLWWLRGLTGDLSILTACLLAVAIYQKLSGTDLLPRVEKKSLYYAVGILGLLFYPLALGLGQVDPYAWGYANPYMASTILFLAIIAFVLQFYVVAISSLLVVLLWNFGVLESVNLWDYLLDPFITFYALGKIVRHKW